MAGQNGPTHEVEQAKRGPHSLRCHASAATPQGRSPETAQSLAPRGHTRPAAEPLSRHSNDIEIVVASGEVPVFVMIIILVRVPYGYVSAATSSRHACSTGPGS